MAEKGKIIQVNFDKDVKESSIAGNESAFTVSGHEKLYVPGTEPEAKAYTVEDIGPAFIRLEKKKIEDGTFVNSTIDANNLKLTRGTSTTGNVGRTSWSGAGSHTYNYGLRIITNGPIKIVSFECHAASAGTISFGLYRRGSSDVLVQSFSKSVVAGSNTITLNYDIESGDTYYLGFSSNGHIGLYRQADSTVYENTILGISGVTGTQYAQGSYYPGYYYYFYNIAFEKTGNYDTSGSWAFPIEADSINKVYDSLIEWTQTTPTNTSVVVKTGISNSATTQPTTWDIATSGAAMPSISANDDLTGKWVWIKIELSTTDDSVTPTVEEDIIARIREIIPKSIWLLIEGWAGINKDTGDVTVAYDATAGTLAGDSSGSPQVENFTETFTPTDLIPINNPGILEAAQMALGDIAITRTKITFIENTTKEAAQMTLGDLTITRTNIDDLDP